MRKVRQNIRRGQSKTDHMIKMFGVTHASRLSDVYSKLLRRYPRIVLDLLEDLMQIDGYSEIEIAFGAQIPLDVVRSITLNETVQVSREYFLSILELYTRVFCQEY